MMDARLTPTRPSPSIGCPVVSLPSRHNACLAPPACKRRATDISLLPMAQSDDDLEDIQRAAAGERMAMHALLTRHSPAIYALGMRMLNRAEDAEDVTQETFLRAWKILPNWQPDARLSTWLHRVALNLCYDRLRKPRAHLFAEPPEMTDPADTPEAALSARQTKDRVQTAITQLPERQRAAITLCALQGHSNKDAAEILDISVQALESLLSRGRATLKTYLADTKRHAS